MKRIVDRSNGMLAPVKGTERLATLACGHWAQFVKAVRHGCVTPCSRLQDRDGRLNQQALSQRDARFGRMCTGWKHFVLPFRCQVAWPRLCALAQKALNASNLVPTQGNELEAATTLLEYVASMDDVNWSIAGGAVAQTAQCKDYMGAVSRICQEYAGGTDGPIIRKLDLFAKRLGATARLGEDFTVALSNTEWHCKGRKFERVRATLLACKLTSPIVTDGVYGLIDATDVARAASKTKSDASLRAEMALADAELFLKHVASIIDEGDLLAVECALWDRIALYLVGKEAKGVEKVAYLSIDAILAAFASKLDELVTAGNKAHCKNVTNICSWPTGTAAAGPSKTRAAPAAPAAAADAAPVADPSNPIHMASKLGFAVGQYVVEKAAPSEVYVVESVGSDVVLKSASLFHDPITVKVTLGTFFETWKVGPKDIQCRVPVSEALALTQDGRNMSKVKAWLALQCAEPSTLSDILNYFKNPLEVRAAVDIPKRQLRLVPHTTLDRCATNATPVVLATCTDMQNGHVICLTPPPNAADVKPLKGAAICPFWWVLPTSDVNKANLVLESWVEPQNGMSVSVFRNNEVITKHSVLRYYKPVKKLANIRVRAAAEEAAKSEQAAADAATPPPPTKKRRSRAA